MTGWIAIGALKIPDYILYWKKTQIGAHSQPDEHLAENIRHVEVDRYVLTRFDGHPCDPMLSDMKIR